MRNRPLTVVLVVVVILASAAFALRGRGASLMHKLAAIHGGR